MRNLKSGVGTEKSLGMEDQRVDISPSKAARDFFKERAPRFKSIDWEVGFCREESRNARSSSGVIKVNGVCKQESSGEIVGQE